MLVHKDLGRWNNFGQAFYAAHLELFLGNGCLGKGSNIRCNIFFNKRIFYSGVGVMMLLVLTIERYVCVCHPDRSRPVMGPPRCEF